MPRTVLSGARIVGQVGGVGLVWGSGVNYGEEFQYDAAETINSMPVREWVPVGYRCNLSADMFRTVGDGDGEGSLKKQGIAPANRGTPNEILLKDPMDMSLVETVNNVPVILLSGVNLASYSVAVTPRGLLGQNCAFVCISGEDEESLGS